MPTVLLRFYGRFAFAEGRNADNTPNGTIAALAPNYNTGGFEPHEVIMWIRRDAVVTKNNAGVPVTNLRPLHRLVSEGPIQQAECFVWDLRGRTVQVRDRQIAELPKDHGIADLADLENRKGRTAVFDKTFLNGSTNGPASAAIRLAGTGSTGVAFRGRCDFVSLPDAHANTPNPPTYGTTPTQFADFVEFEIGLTQMDPDQPPQSEPPQLTLEITDPDATSFNNLVVVKATTTVTIGFSNRCATLPTSPPFDFEFGPYYELLKNPPNDRLIPREIRGGGEAGDCDRLAYIPHKSSP
jgi:hypothetical protein